MQQKLEIIISNSEHETINIGKKIIQDFKHKNLFLIRGDLGSGKTILVKGMSKSLNVKDEIISPTFVIKKTYNEFDHYDLYSFKDRISVKEIVLMINEDLSHKKVFVEWSDKISYKNFENYLDIFIKKGENNLREITLIEH